jgi:gas vesicle protein
MNEYPYGGDMGRGPSNYESNTGVNLGGFMIGALVGASLALLLAPASGGETRRRLGDTAKKIGNVAKDKIQDMQSSGSQPGRTSS